MATWPSSRSTRPRLALLRLLTVAIPLILGSVVAAPDVFYTLYAVVRSGLAAEGVVLERAGATPFTRGRLPTSHSDIG
ncbi:uncharacterized protein C8Q71DRAFT_791409 [Rhodofomes roseus]|uniref:Uncharacterized protein n=1 Tax=Rhodofomes roseus TaxID=34475 RepID=A0ABQ8JY80_9APHY|nr:uncharacterized protein C8Q71DRAFT_791409 [Rhodofomes roseus]KAH9829157.1 hypothetical protein C8Q71DRAFT_791409 [Rhodofomes roseus]